MTSAEATHSFLIPLSTDAKAQDWLMTKLQERIRIDVCNEVHLHTRLSLPRVEMRDAPWVAKSGVARLQLKKVDKGLQFIVTPDLNIVASLDFVNFYRSCLNPQGELAPSPEGLTEYTRKQPSFVLQSMGESSAHATISEQLFLYQRCADELILLATNAVYFLEHTVQRIASEGSLCTPNLRKYLHSLYVQMDTERLDNIVHSDAAEVALIAQAHAAPYGFTVTDSLMGFDFTCATIETRLRDQGYDVTHANGLRVWVKDGAKPIACSFVSCHTASQLKQVQEECIGRGLSVSRKELAPWLTFEQGRQSITSILSALHSDTNRLTTHDQGRKNITDTLISQNSVTDGLSPKNVIEKVTGVAAQYLYPEGCSAIFITVSPEPDGDYAFYSPMLLGRTIQSSAFTIQMFSERVEANGPLSSSVQ